MESSMLGAQAGAMTPAQTRVTAVGACTPNGMAAVLLPGTDAPLMERARAVVAAATTPLTEGAQAQLGRQDTPQHNPQKFAYKNRIAATNGAAAGPLPAWDPV